MNNLIKTGALLVAMLLGGTGHAATTIATFDIENMTCAGCRYIVKKSMAEVEGVQDVTVSYKQRQATVTFDDALTNPQAISEASTTNGYPATLVEAPQ